MITQLYLLDFIFQKTPFQGLNNNVQVGDVGFSSTIELLKCWTLLSAMGHAEGTFDTEKFWTEVFHQSKPVRSAFLSLIKDEENSQIAERFIDRQQFYLLHRSIAAFFIHEDIAKGRQTADSAHKWLTTLAALSQDHESGSTLAIAKDLLRSVRLIAYTHLDLGHSSIGIRMVLPLVMQQIERDPGIMVGGAGAALDRQLMGVQPLLFRNLYATPSAVEQRARYWLRRWDDLRKKFDPLSQVQSPRSKFTQYFRNTISADFKTDRGDPLEHALRIELWEEPGFPSREIHPIDIEDRLRSRTDGRWCHVVTPTQFDEGGGATLDVFNRAALTARDWSRMLNSTAKEIDGIFSERRRDLEWEMVESSSAWHQLYVQIVKMFLRPDVNPVVDVPSFEPDLGFAFLPSRARIRQWDDLTRKETRRLNPTSGRRWELDSLRRAVRNDPAGPYLITHCRVMLEDAQRTRIGDLDVSFIRISATSTALKIGGAKSSVSPRSQSGRTQLESLMFMAFGVETPEIVGSGSFYFTSLDLRQQRMNRQRQVAYSDLDLKN